MIAELKSQWIDLSSKYFEDESIIESVWEEILKQYTSKNRHYHSLSHLYHMFLHLEDFKTEIENLDHLKFAIWYHDVIYESINKDNEKQSAHFAGKALKTSNFDDFETDKVKNLIISTKKHELLLTDNYDNAYLLDLDLSILGTDWGTYKTYIQNIRKEYKIYPDILYKPGRKKVLKHFLERDNLYFTERFKAKFEKQARENIKKEIELL